MRAFLDLLALSKETDHGRQATNGGGYDVVAGVYLFDGYADRPRRLVVLIGLVELAKNEAH